MAKTSTLAVMLVAGCVLGVAAATLSHAHADPQPAFDRQLVERLVRAQEAQVHAIEALTQVTERCGQRR